ncbi:MAG TPA: GAF domain-containing protein [Hymenobacter sp.]|uniref:GAF domain-containing protein n=1 Tax=Hymenobacter sp. TaxID=1898978 RepID=UPI002D7F79DD|nr:GAF domain-containing protein [Hymenobacter sp.]HET9502956.1 GAF domain-containing protein [Hymenobacter sp.]
MTITPGYLLPPNEAERLQALRQYDIRHSLQEPVFNEFVSLTARIFHLPISLIALVDADEVEYKANEGLPGLRHQPRVEALCALAVRQRQTVVLADVAQETNLTAEAAMAAQAKGLRFYAGAPLAMLGHRAIGTLCVIDRRPRTFSADEQRVLEHLARLVAGTIAVRYCCRLGQGDKQWQLVQRHLTDEIRELVALVRYLSARFGHQVPVSGAVLETVQRRLRDLGRLLEEYTTCD